MRAFFLSWWTSHDRAAAAGRVDDRAISRMRGARMTLGLGAGLWLIVSYPLSDGGEEFVLGKIVELGLSCLVLAVGCVVGITTFLVMSTPDRRRDFAERLRGPITAVAMLAAGPLCMWGSVESLQGDLIPVEALQGVITFFGDGIFAKLVAFLLLAVGWLASVAVLLCSIPFTLYSAYMCVFTCLRAGDVHQLLPALISPLLVWSLLAFQLFIGPDVAAPAIVLYTFMFGGPLSVTALSVWEVRRLRVRHGITLRNALGR
ncbi:hypothetical protein [Streptomyces sp. Isolate_45]|uniref:hypothetical protein n=1 Tax=unclassified Streptomyces TaxID=2593676 RepID=UPI002481AC49|nr:hypothetical protein [Streptomyces sp. Isolate_45]MDA5280235.1 hypothetical protein [Streptomyces sp. Isolate_45]